MKHRRPASILAVAFVVLAVGFATACGADPRARFIDLWLQEHAQPWSASTRREVVGALMESEKRTRTDAFLLLAVIEEESRYDPAARSRKGARGLMQIRPSTADDVAVRAGIPWSGPEDLEDAVKNVRIGAAYLAELKQRFGSWETALTAYHAGPTRVRRIARRGGKIPGRYASRVLERYRRIQQAYGTGER